MYRRPKAHALHGPTHAQSQAHAHPWLGYEWRRRHARRNGAQDSPVKMAVDLSRARPRFARMHELALSESVIDAVVERIPDVRIVRVRLRVGRLMAVMPDA